MEDVELTPRNYKKPVMERNQDIYFTVGKKLFQEIHVFYQIVSIETDLDIFGFEDISHLKREEFLKYHSTIQMTNLIENNIYRTGEAFCAVTIKLYDFIKTQRRTYQKLIDILGTVGGVTELVFGFFQIITSIIIDIIYEISLVNNLFEFDIIKNKIKIKNKKSESIKESQEDFTIEAPSGIKYNNKNRKFYSVKSLNKIEETNKICSTSGNRLVKIRIKRKIPKRLSNIHVNIENSIKNENIFCEDQKKEIKEERIKTTNLNNQITSVNNKNDIVNIINKLEFNKANILFCFCLIRKKKNIKNILLDEDMKLFCENMDIINVFQKLINMNVQLNANKEYEISDSGKSKLLDVQNNL
jgi:hypothetical protein